MDEERKSDTAETYGDQDAPGEASNQNSEEPSAPEGGGSTRRSTGQGASSQVDGEERPGNPGGAGEHSQATGHPSNAG
jgi:hypothetical protein